MGWHRSHARKTMLPPPMDSSPVTPSDRSGVTCGLLGATAHAFAREARAAFDAHDVVLLEGAIDALVELAIATGMRPNRS